MSRTLVYDMSRLVTRVLHATPNGIDRVDLMLARHFLLHGEFKTQALGLGFTGPRLIPDRISRGAAERVAAAWREHAVESAGSRSYETMVAHLRGDSPPRGWSSRAPGARSISLTRCSATCRRAAQSRFIPRRTGLSISTPRIFRWRGNATSPGSTSAATCGRCSGSTTCCPSTARTGSGDASRRCTNCASTFWRDVAREPSSRASASNRGCAGIWSASDGPTSRFRLPPPTDALFDKPARFDERLAALPFFIVCGTIEPRKNHLLLLRVWRDLVARYGGDAPKLVVVGKRGWNCADIVAGLEDEALRGHVFEVAGLSTPDYKRLLDHSRALLARSFAEGFGFPVAEALASGVPVVASDIAPFGEQNGDGAIHLDPLSDEAWRRAIVDLAFSATKTPSERYAAIAVAPAMECRRLHPLDAFLKGLA